ncbi:MAG: hypothetical protein AABN95_10275 [Acidobacteriota bacterium]
MKRKTEITIQTRRVLIVRRPSGTTRLQCHHCGPSVEMLPAGEAAAVTSFTERAVFQLAEKGHLHSTETPDGRLFVCLNSLLT